MQIVSEKLSQHVLKNYSAFVSGVNEVASIEQDLTVSSSRCSCCCMMAVSTALSFVAATACMGGFACGSSH